MILPILWGLILVSSYLRFFAAGHCEADTYANGCSVPLGLDTPFKETFTKACDKHDICYGCVSPELIDFIGLDTCVNVS